jgi:hypothetical protein
MAVCGWIVNVSDYCKDTFSGTDWILGEMDLKEFDFDAMLYICDLETILQEFLTMLDDMCDLIT